MIMQNLNNIFSIFAKYLYDIYSYLNHDIDLSMVILCHICRANFFTKETGKFVVGDEKTSATVVLNNIICGWK